MLYIHKIPSDGPTPFDEIVSIFQQFADLGLAVT